MENAADALKMAFAIFVFVIAITVTFALLTEAKNTADVVLFYSDETNFQPHVESLEKATVSYQDVVSTLYRYYKESICVTIVLDDEEYKFDLEKPSSDTEIIEAEIGKFIKEELSNYKDRPFREEFVEIPISGIYDYGEDGTEIIVSSGGKKVYVTYTAL